MVANTEGPLRIGMIGAGKIAEKHLRGYQQLDNVSVVISDITAAGEAVARDYSVDWEGDPRTVLESSDVDIVDVCTPTEAHVNTISTALRNEKHVFCEKPIARTTEEVEEIQRLSEAVGKFVMAGYLYRFHPAYELIHDVLQNEAIGVPHFGIFRLGGRGSHKSWKHMRAQDGGATNEMFVHMLDLILWYFGEPESIELLWHDTVLPTRTIEGQMIDVDAEDIVTLRLNMPGGVHVLCESDFITPVYMNYAEVHGSNGSVMASILDYLPSFVYCQEPAGGFQGGKQSFQFDFVDLFERELGHFIDVVRGKREHQLNSVEDSIRIMRVLDQIGSLAAGK